MTSHDDTDPMTSIEPFQSHPVRAPHVSLRSIKPVNKKLENLMTYRAYRLMSTADTRSSRATAEVRDHLKNLNLTIGKSIFNGTGPKNIFHFLSRFVNYADIFNVSEAHAFITMPIFVVYSAEAQFCNNLSEASCQGGVT